MNIQQITDRQMSCHYGTRLNGYLSVPISNLTTSEAASTRLTVHAITVQRHNIHIGNHNNYEKKIIVIIIITLLLAIINHNNYWEKRMKQDK